MAVGNPTGLRATAGTGRIAAAGQSVEAPGGYLIDDVFSTDAVIEPASSGGPLLAADGRVVGITSRVEGSTGFAVPLQHGARRADADRARREDHPAVHRHQRQSPQAAACR